MRLLVFSLLLSGTASFGIATALPLDSLRTRGAVMRVPDERSKAREALLPDIIKALSEVSKFIATADASRQGKKLPPSADDIEKYCAEQQRKIELLTAEAKMLREADPTGSKVVWTDIDGNAATDAAWLNKIGF